MADTTPEPTADEAFQASLQVTQGGGSGDGSTAKAPEGAGTGATTPAGSKVKIGEEEFDLETLTELVKKGKDYDEAVAGSTRRFQEAADVKKQAETLMQQHGALSQFAQKLASMPEDAQNQLFAFAAQIDEAIASGKPINQTAPGFVIPKDAQLPELPAWEDLSDETRAVLAALTPHLARLQHLETQVGKVGEILPDVTAFVKGTREQRAQAEAAVELSKTYSATLKRAITPEEVAQAMTATKLTDPEAAWLKANALGLIKEATNNGAVQRQTKAIETPAGETETFDPKGMTADQIMAQLQAGKTMQAAS